MIYNFKDKTVLITGATSGIGEEFACQLAKLGAKLVLTGRNKTKLEKLTGVLDNSIAIAGDLSQQKFPDELYKFTIEKKLEVDVLINNVQ